MHNENEFNDMLLNEAMRAMQDAPIPAGPSVATMQATLNVIERGQRERRGPVILARVGSTLHRHRLAACILVPLPIAAAIISLLIPSVGPARHAAAFAAVLQQIRSAETIQFRVAYTTWGQPTQTRRVLCKGDRTRVEFDQGPIMISDSAARRILTLMPDVHKAFLAPMPPDDTSAQANDSSLFSKIRNLQNVPGAYRGLREENGRQLADFQTEQKGIRFNILADPRTDQAVRITMEVPLFEASLLMSDFVFDSEISDDLFSLIPPPGYVVKQQEGNQPVMIDTANPSEEAPAGTSMAVGVYTVTVPSGAEGADFSAPTEQDLIAFLKLLVERNSGVFPSQKRFLQPEDLQARLMAAPADQRDEITRDLASVFTKKERAHAHLRQSGAIDPEYIGEGVSLGDSARPVLLWGVGEPPKVKVVFGDLSVGEYSFDSPEWQALCKTLPESHVHEPLRLGPAAAPVPALPEE